ncbi:unnamed protein product, partial [Amoebophrya sp. A120]
FCACYLLSKKALQKVSTGANFLQIFRTWAWLDLEQIGRRVVRANVEVARRKRQAMQSRVGASESDTGRHITNKEDSLFPDGDEEEDEEENEDDDVDGETGNNRKSGNTANKRGTKSRKAQLGKRQTQDPTGKQSTWRDKKATVRVKSSRRSASGDNKHSRATDAVCKLNSVPEDDGAAASDDKSDGCSGDDESGAEKKGTSDEDDEEDSSDEDDQDSSAEGQNEDISQQRTTVRNALNSLKQQTRIVIKRVMSTQGRTWRATAEVMYDNRDAWSADDLDDENAAASQNINSPPGRPTNTL